MTAHPIGLAGRTDASHVNRVVKFTTRDVQDSAPDVLTLIKREVETLDQLEVSDPSAWAARIALMPPLYQRMFQGGTYNRIRSRYLLYGLSNVDLLALLGNLVSVNYSISSWLRLAQATTSAGKYTSIPDILNVNPAAQPDTDRQPTVGTSANGFSIATWDGSDVIPWTVIPANNSTAAWFLMMWAKPTSNITSRQRLFKGFFPGSTSKVQIDIVSGGFEINWYTNTTDGRQQVVAGAVTASIWQSLRFQFNGAGAADADKMKCFVEEVDKSSTYGNIGAGGAMASLNSASGFYTIGAREDQDAPTSALLNGFQTGPNIFVGSAALSVAQGASLRNIEKPT